MYKIILDTNFLLIPAYFNVDIISEIERICLFDYNLAIIDQTIDEINKIIAIKEKKAKTGALIAQQIIENNNFEIISTKEEKYQDYDVDSVILMVAKDNDYIVATHDMELKKRLKKEGIKVIILRQKKYLQCDNF
jgi:uncharacterized protein